MIPTNGIATDCNLNKLECDNGNRKLRRRYDGLSINRYNQKKTSFPTSDGPNRTKDNRKTEARSPPITNSNVNSPKQIDKPKLKQSGPDESRAEVKCPELYFNTLLYVKESIRRFNVNDSTLNGHKKFSFSEPVPVDRLRQRKISSKKPAICDYYLPRFLESIQRDRLSSKPDLKSAPLAKLNRENEDIVRYLRLFEDDKSFHTSTLKCICGSHCQEGYESKELSAEKTTTGDKNDSKMDNCYDNVDVAEKDQNERYDLCLRCSEFKDLKSEYNESSSFSTMTTFHNTSPRFATEIHNERIQSLKSSENNSRQPSVDTFSVLSSETDSDFTYYRCKSCTSDRGTLRPTNLDSKLCKLPSNLEDPDSPLPPFRPEFLESSLENFTRQFYLDDDALSDDVFVDESTVLCRDCTELNKTTVFKKGSNSNEPQKDCRETVVARKRYSLNSDAGQMENQNAKKELPQGEMCGEKLRNLSLTIVYEDKLDDSRSNSGDRKDHRSGEIMKESLMTNQDDDAENLLLEFDDCELSEYNLTLANAFDSLRRNSMQSKSRKLWKERRAKMRRSNLFQCQTASLSEGIKSPMEMNRGVKETIEHSADTVEGTISSFPTKDHSETTPHVTVTAATKPLRGILKNKNGGQSYRPFTYSSSMSATLFNTSMNSDFSLKENRIQSKKQGGNDLCSPNSCRVEKRFDESLMSYDYDRDEDRKQDVYSYLRDIVSPDSDNIDWVYLLQQQHLSPTHVSPTLMSQTHVSPTLMSPTHVSPTLMSQTHVSPTLMSQTHVPPTFVSVGVQVNLPEL